MKKLFAILAVGLAFSAQAQVGNFVQGEVSRLNDQQTRESNVGAALSFGVGLSKNDTVGLKLGTVSAGQPGPNDVSSNVEGFYTRSYEFGNYQPFVRVAAGQYFSGTNVGYYSIEPGVRVKLTEPLAFKTSYSFSDTFDSKYMNKTNTAKVGLEYTVVKNITVGGNYVSSHGDYQAHGFEFLTRLAF